MRVFSFSLVATLALSLALLNPVQAISVGPAIIDVSVDAGQQTDFSILVTNEEQQALSFALTIQKFIPQGESGQTFFLPASDTSGLPDWLYLEAPTLTLRPGESRRLPVSLRVPNDAAPGGHYAAIFLTQTSLDTAAGQNVSAIPRIGVLVFATVNGSLVERIALRDANVDQADGSRLPVRFSALIENQGNVHVQPKLQIQIVNVFGKAVATIDANTDEGRILPGSKRMYQAEWAKARVDEGEGFFHGLQQEWRNWGLGWYEARIQAASRVGEAGEMRVRFQVWPWRTLLVGAGLLLVLAMLYKLVRKALYR